MIADETEPSDEGHMKMGTNCDKKKKNLRMATWNKGGANQQLKKKVLDIEACLNKYDLDYLGITEANLRKCADLEEVAIKGYRMIWDLGRENPSKENSRVVVYVKEELSFEIMQQHMGGNLMPEVWIKLGHARTKRTLVGTVYREHTPWGTKDGSQKGQELRLKKWLEARREIWAGTQEAYLLGDINLDWLKRKEKAYRSQKMMLNLCDELQGTGWVQLIQKATHFNNSTGREATSSLIDHIWTNLPSKVISCKQTELGTSDHELVWVDRMAKQLVEKVKITEKRSLKNFRIKDLEKKCWEENWDYIEGGERTKEMLEDRVKVLSEKIRNILETVAPMRKKKLVNRGKPRWLVEELEEKMKERARSRRKAKTSKLMEDELEARKVRNDVTKLVRKAKQDHLKKSLENLEKNSPDAWAAVGEHLGWRKPMAPTMLIQDGDVRSTGQEMAETMIEQYRRKEIEVNQSLGPAREDYLDAGRKMTKGNKGTFSFKPVTEKDVRKQIAAVANKESFGNDEISYGYLKKMSRWISKEMAAIMNHSLEVKTYPASWKIARVKPLFKGEGCDRHDPKSYRPVALLSGMSRIMEAILARQLDNYQERNNLVHPGVHGFRKSRGTNTAMLEVWEYVIKKTEKGELVALDFLDCSAGFDSMVHLHILRKMEIQFGMSNDSVEWLDSYLDGWIQYTVVEASNSTPRRMKNGVPQGGGLSPILWRSSTNDIPEAGLRNIKRRRQREQEDVEVQPGRNVPGEFIQAEQRTVEVNQQEDTVKRRGDQIPGSVISRRVDNIAEGNLTTEELLDKHLRQTGRWKLDEWKNERICGGEHVTDKLSYRKEKDEKDVVTTIYADDTQSRASAKTLKELERRNGEGVTRVCKALKALRLKVNETKTTYMIIATQGIRLRENLANKVSKIDVCGQQVQNVRVGKALGLLISDDLTWRDNISKVVQNCEEKMRGLWKITNLLRKDQRKVKAEAIIISRLSYCLEITSTGRKSDMERLQGVQSAAARWISQTRRRDWRLKQGLKKLGWLSMCQRAAYMSILSAMKILKNKKPERLYEVLTEENEGHRQRKIVNEPKFLKLKMTTRKSWSWRSLRWLEKMPHALRERDPTKTATKTELKKWVRDRIPVRGCRIMWGRKLEGEGGGRHFRRNQQPDTQGDGDQGHPEENRGEENINEDGSEQSPRTRNIEAGDNQTVGVQELVRSVGCSEDKLQSKQFLRQERENHSRRAAKTRNRGTAWRCMRIKHYTAIVELGSSTGQATSDTKLVLNGTKSSTQEHEEQLPSSWAFSVPGGVKGQGRGPWKPAWPPPWDRAVGLWA